jgi:hypothetical protein
MYRHVSIFTLKEKENTETFIALLKEVSEEAPSVVRYEIGRNFGKAPDGPGPDFGDIIQILDFETIEDLNAWPATQEHIRLLREGPENEKVTAIDYEV